MSYKIPIRWKEFRKIIAASLGSGFQDIGFKNPGFKMYRFREHFIDIIQFCPNKYHTQYTLGFGSHPRKDRQFKGNESYWHFMFKGILKKNDEFLSFDIPNTCKKAKRQVNCIQYIAINQAVSFFDKFQLIEDAIDILMDESSDTFLYLKSGIGSLSNNDDITILRTLQQATKQI